MSAIEAVTPTSLVRGIFDILNDHDLPSLSAVAADDIVETWPVVGRLEGQAVAAHFAAIFAAFPDLRIEIERMAADGETVFVHWHMTGAFTGTPLLGFEATGRHINVRGTDCFTIRDGRVVGNFVAYDGMTFAAQMGILPAHGSRMDRAMTAAANWITRIRRTLQRHH